LEEINQNFGQIFIIEIRCGFILADGLDWSGAGRTQAERAGMPGYTRGRQSEAE